jgi:hypothetical protein
MAMDDDRASEGAFLRWDPWETRTQIGIVFDDDGGGVAVS